MYDLKTINIPELIFIIMTWGFILYLFLHKYKEQPEKPKLWRALLTTIIGLFSFTITLIFFQEPISLALLPLGVWILYFFLKGKGRWQVYRPYAWLGFLANYLFLAASIVAILVHGFIFPTNMASTLVANVEDAEVIAIHPSAKEVKVDRVQLEESLSTMEANSFYSDEWYSETYLEIDEPKAERFPYLLVNTSSKFGSGMSTQTFIEKDGKGLLISTEKDQYYFRSENQPTVLQGLGEEENE